MPPPDDYTLTPVEHDPWKVPSPDFDVPPPGLRPSAPLGMPPGMTMAQPPGVVGPETAKRSAAGLLEPFGKLGRFMTRQSTDPVGDIAAAAAGLAPIGPPGTGKALKAAGQKTGTLSDFITAYHGSPHDFDRFDLSKIGTGEGAQAYGRGLYFAENEGVAKGYRNKLSGPMSYTYKGSALNDKNINKIIPDKDLADYLKGHMKWGNYSTDSIGKHIDELNELIRTKSQDWPIADQQKFQRARDAMMAHQNDLGVDIPGKMYQVAIKAPPEHFLDWDKPIGEQHSKVAEALSAIENKNAPAKSSSWELGGQLGRLREHLGKSGREMDAGMFVKSMEGAYGHEGTAQALREAGIPGIKYLDHGSRPGHNNSAAGNAAQDILKFYGGDRTEAAKQFENRISGRKSARQGEDIPFRHDRPGDPQEVLRLLKSGEPLQSETHNYVVFDDKLIDIIKKYGIAGLAALPAAGAYHFRTQDVDHDPFASAPQ